MASGPIESEDPISESPNTASIPGDPFPWAPKTAPADAAAPDEPAPKAPEEPEELDDDLMPRDLGEVD